MKTKLLAIMLLAGGSLFAESHWSFGISIGVPYYAPVPAPPVAAYMPACPGPGYVWIPGYYYPEGRRFAWREGYWSRPPYAGAYWVTPRYYEQRYYPGYWQRRDDRWDRRDDRWDRDRGRDRDRWERRDRGEHRGWDR